MKTISCPAFYESASSANFKLHEEQTSNCFIGIIGNTLAKLCSLTCEIKFSQSMCENHTSTTNERWLLINNSKNNTLAIEVTGAASSLIMIFRAGNPMSNPFYIGTRAYVNRRGPHRKGVNMDVQ